MDGRTFGFPVVVLFFLVFGLFVWSLGNLTPLSVVLLFLLMAATFAIGRLR